MNSSIGNRRRALGASGNVWSISASRTNAICRRSPPHLGRSLVHVEEITPGWFGAWFICSFAEASPKSRRASAPGKIKPGQQTDLSVLDRFLSGNEAYRDLILRALAATT